MKVGKLEREIDSVCKKKTIQFNNKQKSTDLKITVSSILFFSVGRVVYFILFVLFIYVFIYLHICGWVSRVLFLLVFFF